ncbi:hypothetical protein BTN49_1675 [Candidatus Enterovibrio escicola]|uniref:Uncharacterized protein n=1 Tax=Candidatus Enterovibrio escicola TaxID=1927127 RepID=A0A2A5T3I1_9GAMM|nr:hypothetical protein BTN49_1675 [Candidatus Enterovibrio escacola]
MWYIPCWLLIWRDQSTGHTALFPTHTPEITIALNLSAVQILI